MTPQLDPIREEIADGILRITFLDSRLYAKHREMYDIKGAAHVSGAYGYYPSITWVLDYTPADHGLLRWFGDSASYAAAIAYRDNRGAYGTRIDLMVDHLCRGGKVNFGDIPPDGSQDPLTDHEYRTLLQFHGWVERFQPVFLGTQETVEIETEYGFSAMGTLDIACTIDSDRLHASPNKKTEKLTDSGLRITTVVDEKISNSVYDTHRIQVDTYRRAKGYEAGAILLLDQQTKSGFTFSVNKDVDYLKSLWDSACLAWRAKCLPITLNQIDVPTTITLPSYG